MTSQRAQFDRSSADQSGRLMQLISVYISKHSRTAVCNSLPWRDSGVQRHSGFWDNDTAHLSCVSSCAGHSKLSFSRLQRLCQQKTLLINSVEYSFQYTQLCSLRRTCNKSCFQSRLIDEIGVDGILETLISVSCYSVINNIRLPDKLTEIFDHPWTCLSVVKMSTFSSGSLFKKSQSS